MKFVYKSIYAHTERSGCEDVELNVQPDHVPSLRTKKYWGNHFWSVGFCVDTVSMDAEMIRKYLKYQDDK
jgi:putative transposase